MRTWTAAVTVGVVLACFGVANAAIMNDDLWQGATSWGSDGGWQGTDADLFDGTSSGLAIHYWSAGASWGITFASDAAAAGISQIIVNIESGSGGVPGHVAITGHSGAEVTLVNADISGFGEHVFNFPKVTGQSLFHVSFTSATEGWYRIAELDAVPEPATLALLATGGLLIRRRSLGR